MTIDLVEDMSHEAPTENERSDPAGDAAANRRQLVYIALALTFVSSIALVVGVILVKGIWYPGSPFDAAKWQDPVLVENGVRLEMADRLVQWGTLLEKTEAEAIAMLGPPDDCPFANAQTKGWWLGPERGFMSIDSEWLVLTISGKEPRVSEAKILRD
ncbi:MAG: hypothetical protein KDA80_17995 [Planctomycetaceae bacterium]|nr:hypothetical protein [Planctomycetaceae bacterium]